MGDPLIVEVGCGSGWNREVLAHLLKRKIRYVGMDWSYAMASHGQRMYSGVPFVVGDAACLPLGDGACDILVSGTVLMHVLDYRRAIQESRRVARRWCILHTMPVVQKRPTTILRKFAYGVPVAEIIFNEQELVELIEANCMTVREIFESFPYDLGELLEEPTGNRTYLCEIRRPS